MERAERKLQSKKFRNGGQKREKVKPKSCESWDRLYKDFIHNVILSNVAEWRGSRIIYFMRHLTRPHSYPNHSATSGVGVRQLRCWHDLISSKKFCCFFFLQYAVWSSSPTIASRILFRRYEHTGEVCPYLIAAQRKYFYAACCSGLSCIAFTWDIRKSSGELGM